jgi:outer membrane protein assembly factor BamB
MRPDEGRTPRVARRRLGLVGPIAVFAAVAVLAVTVPSAGEAATARTATATTGHGLRAVPSSWDWPSYGHDAQHTFHGRTTLTESTARTLKLAWTFPTGDAVTATPTVVGGSVFVGSWDGYFYDIALATGQLRWKFQLKAQPALTPYPGEVPRDISSDGGLVTSSAWFQPGGVGQPDLVIFAGGYTLYALNAASGALVWEHDYTGLPELPPDPTGDYTRIFSSPAVFDGKVMIGVDVDGERGHRGYVVAASLQTGDPAWVFQTDANSQGAIMNDGCGNVWSSGTVIPNLSEVVFDEADCSSNPVSITAIPTEESVFALDIGDGHLVWSYRPPRPDRNCDLDFGATANVGLAADGRASFLGVGGKDGSYYSLDPATGLLRWVTNVVFGGSAGGFIGTTAYDRGKVYGSTAIGDLNTPVCDPSSSRDTSFQEPSAHALNARTGRVLWEAPKATSFAPTTVARDMTFNCPAFINAVQVRDAGTGSLINELAIPVACWSGIATAGNALVLGTGTSAVGSPDAVLAFTPGGRPPRVPGH